MPINNFRNITTTGIDEDALVTITAGDKVRNFAAVATTGDLANGVYAGADDIFVDNFGRIETGGAGAEGVLIEGAGARVRNFGSIVTHGSPTDDFLHFNDAIAVYGDEFNVENRGELETEGSDASGVFAFGDGGLIRNFGSVSTLGARAPALIAIGDGGLIHNLGSISTLGDRSNAISAFGDNFHLDNSGTLETEGAFSRGIFALGNDGLIRNFGSISTMGRISPGLLAGGDGNTIINYGDIRINDPLGFSNTMDATGSQNEVVNFGTLTGGGMFAGAPTVLAGSGNTVTNWGIISSDDLDGAMIGTGRNALVQNFGTIEAEVGIQALGDAGTQARNDGTILTQGDLGDGLHVETGADGEAVNAGSIRTEGDGAAGVFIISSIGGGQVTNSGSIETFGGLGGDFGTAPAAGVDAFGLDVLVHNTRTGSIETHDPNSPAVSLNIRDIGALSYRPGVIAADTQSRLENDGLIKAVQTAVLGGPGDETVINRGRIVGDVDLGAGDDEFVAGKGGILDGDLFLGAGDDLVQIENGSGTTQIVDFVSGEDSIDVSAFFSDPADLAVAVSDTGDDLVIALDENDELVLVGVPDFNAADFGLV